MYLILGHIGCLDMEVRVPHGLVHACVQAACTSWGRALGSARDIKKALSTVIVMKNRHREPGMLAVVA